MGLRRWLGLKKSKQNLISKKKSVRTRRPNHVIDVGPSAPCLAVIGDFQHFTGSTLAAVLHGHWNMVPASDACNTWQRSNAFIKWAPWSDYVLQESLRIDTPGRIINDTHLDCDKANVQKFAHLALGYASSVDPTIHVGHCVQKSRRNAAHDGKVILCPTSKIDETCVYEVLVDNRHGDSEINDIRLVIILGELPVAYIKYRPLATRFGNENARVILTTPEALLSQQELEQCRSFAHAIGMEYGELDILRDNASGLIYIVDVNPTPCGPPPQLEPADREKTLRAQFRAITGTFETTCRRPA